MHLAILHIASTFGGAERTTVNLLERLDRNKFSRITVLAPEIMRPYFSAADVFVSLEGHCSGGWFGNLGSLFSDARGLGRLLKELKPDLTLAMMHYPASLMALTRFFGYRGKIVASFRGPLYEHMKYFESGKIHRLLLYTATILASRLAHRIIVPSQGVRNELIQRFWAPPARIDVILNGIDVQRVHQSMLMDNISTRHDHRANYQICAIARLSAEKNLLLLLDAFSLLVKKGISASLLIIGDGPDLVKLSQRVSELGLSHSITFVGRQDNVFPFLHQADIFLHTCHYEGFGYTILEAMACGVPVIATDCPYGPREIIGQGVYGILVRMNDPAALAQSLSDLLANPERRAALTQQGLRRANQLSLDKIISQFEDTLLALCVKDEHG